MTLCQLVKAIDDFNGETYQKDFLFYQQVLAQQPNDKNKIYSLHEPDVYVIAKGKDHKQYEYGKK
jgi:IS5 family transposase